MSTKNLVGYVRFSTAEQNPVVQLDMLNAAGWECIFVEAVCGWSETGPT